MCLAPLEHTESERLPGAIARGGGLPPTGAPAPELLLALQGGCRMLRSACSASSFHPDGPCAHPTQPDVLR